MREAKGAIFSTQDVLSVDQSIVELLKQRAKQADLRRFRLCLHHSTDEPVQEMLIAACGDGYCQPHRHPGRSEMYLVIEGDVAVFLFGETGKLAETIELGPPGSGKAFCCRLSSSDCHMLVSRAQTAVYMEVLSGPNPDGRATEYAAWSPEEDDLAAVSAFLKKLGIGD